jgi:hypothetical protein
VLSRARRKDPIFVSRSVCLLLLAICSVRMWPSAPCACCVLGER